MHSVVNSKPLERKVVIDLLRIIAISGVIFIHSTSQSLEMVNNDIIRYPVLILENQLARFAVPLFFLISGYILEYRYRNTINIKIFYKKRAIRLIIPYLFWSTIYFYVIDKQNLSHFNLLTFLQKLLYGDAATHLYFIPAIIILYITFPKLHCWLTTLMKPINIFSLTVLTIFLLIADYNFGALFLIPSPLRIALLNAPLFITGMIISHKESTYIKYIKKRILLCIAFIIISAFIIVYECNTIYLQTHNARFITSQWRPSIFLYTITLTSLIYYFNDKIQKLPSKFIFKLSRLTFFVFFSHLIFIHVFWKLFGAYLFNKSTGHISAQLWFDPFAFFFVTISSFVFAYAVSFIPKLNRMTGIE